MARMAGVWVGLLASFLSGMALAENPVSLCTKEEVNAWLASNEKNIVKPVYPPQARREGRQGSVLLKISVDENGTLQNLLLMKSSGFPDLDVAAGNAYKTAKFSAPSCGGKPSAITAEIPIRFALGDAGTPVSRNNAPASPEERKSIEELLAVTGALQLGKTFSDMFVKQMSSGLKKQHPEIPDKMFDALTEEVNKAIDESMNARGGLKEIIVAIYHRYYSADEIQALLDFYRTPVGKKTIAIMPAMTQESMALGMQWGNSLGPLVLQRIKARFKQNGYEI